MLNLECQTVYDILRNIAGEDGAYKIIEAEEIIERLPQEVPISRVQISHIIKELNDREYLDVRYFTPDEYCLMIRRRINEATKATNLVETESAPQTPSDRVLYGQKQEKPQRSVKTGAIFLMSLLGSLIGSGIVGAVVAIVIKFVVMR